MPHDLQAFWRISRVEPRLLVVEVASSHDP